MSGDAAMNGDAVPSLGVPCTTGPGGQLTAFTSASNYKDTVRSLYHEGYHLCSDLTAVDYLTHPGRTLPEGVVPERFEVVVNLLDVENRRRVRVRTQVSGEAPAVDSLFDLYPGSEAMEREAFDLFGISFAGHPDLTRILMPEEWEGHPLRKDYGLGSVPVRFKEAGVRPEELVHTGQDRATRLAAQAAAAIRPAGGIRALIPSISRKGKGQ